MSTKIQPLTWSKGVNLFVDPASLGEGELALAQNCWSNKLGTSFDKRKSMQCEHLLSLVWGSTLYAPRTPPFTAGNARRAYPLNMMALKLGIPAEWLLAYVDATDGNTYLDVAVSGGLGGAFENGRRLGDFELAQGPQLLGETRRPQFVRYGTTIFAFDGLHPGWTVMPDTTKTSGVAIAPFGTSPANSLTPKLACVTRERMVLFDLGPGFENAMLWSDTGQPYSYGTDVLSSNGFYVPIGNRDEGAIIAAFEVMTTSAGSPNTAAILVLKQRAAYMVMGEPNQTTDVDLLGTLEVVRLNTEAGCVSRDTVVKTPYGWLWCGVDDVWHMAEGSLPQRVGTKLRPALLAQPESMWWKLHAAYYEGAYRLAIFGGAQGPSNTSPCSDQWWLDLRKGAPQGAMDAEWWGPQRYVPALGDAGTYFMVRDTTDDKADRLLAPHSGSMVSKSGTNETGFMSIVNFDGDEPYDRCYRKFRTFPRWSANTAYLLEDIICPEITGSWETDPIAWYCFVAGTSAGTEPTWSHASSVTEGSGVQWVPVLARDLTGGGTWGSVLPAETAPDLETANAVLQDIVFKEYDFGDRIVDKLIDGVELSYAAQRTQAFQLILGGRGSQGLGLVGPDDTMNGNEMMAVLSPALQPATLNGTTGDPLDPNNMVGLNFIAGTSSMERNFQTMQVYPTALNARLTCKTARVRLRERYMENPAPGALTLRFYDRGNWVDVALGLDDGILNGSPAYFSGLLSRILGQFTATSGRLCQFTTSGTSHIGAFYDPLNTGEWAFPVIAGASALYGGVNYSTGKPANYFAGNRFLAGLLNFPMDVNYELDTGTGISTKFFPLNRKWWVGHIELAQVNLRWRAFRRRT